MEKDSWPVVQDDSLWIPGTKAVPTRQHNHSNSEKFLLLSWLRWPSCVLHMNERPRWGVPSRSRHRGKMGTVSSVFQYMTIPDLIAPPNPVSFQKPSILSFLISIESWIGIELSNSATLGGNVIQLHRIWIITRVHRCRRPQHATDLVVYPGFEGGMPYELQSRSSPCFVSQMTQYTVHIFGFRGKSMMDIACSLNVLHFSFPFT